jgi:hypothetical protein
VSLSFLSASFSPHSLLKKKKTIFSPPSIPAAFNYQQLASKEKESDAFNYKQAVLVTSEWLLLLLLLLLEHTKEEQKLQC